MTYVKVSAVYIFKSFLLLMHETLKHEYTCAFYINFLFICSRAHYTAGVITVQKIKSKYRGVATGFAFRI